LCVHVPTIKSAPGQGGVGTVAWKERTLQHTGKVVTPWDTMIARSGSPHSLLPFLTNRLQQRWDTLCPQQRCDLLQRRVKIELFAGAPLNLIEDLPEQLKFDDRSRRSFCFQVRVPANLRQWQHGTVGECRVWGWGKVGWRQVGVGVTVGGRTPGFVEEGVQSWPQASERGGSERFITVSEWKGEKGGRHGR
jgi:hypothetical protein